MLNGDEIAIIGISCRFPAADNVEEFWENLVSGKESISFLSPEEVGELARPLLTGASGYVPSKGGVLEHAHRFDPSFFGYSPKEAALMDPQMRQFHEIVWHALEDAGYIPGEYTGRVGLFAAASDNLPWRNNVLFSEEDNLRSSFALTQLIDKDFTASRVAYALDLTGPCCALNTACSTSLVALHLACQAVLNGESELAVAGGISINYGLEEGYIHKEGGILSPDGHCRPFDAHAAGTIPASGAGVVVIKLLEHAVRDRDAVYAVIKGSAVNNDGNRKIGYTSPGIEGQARVIRAALDMAGVHPWQLKYIEAHGTGTPLGDPVEIEALKLVFGKHAGSSCGIGSLKSNLGHMDVAAGIGGLIKTALILKHRKIPPTLHFSSPNPKINIAESPFYVVDRLTPLGTGPDPLLAGVSSFGIGGTNCHMILEEFVAENVGAASPQEGNDPANRLIVLSAKTHEALLRTIDNLCHHLEKHPDLSVEDLAFSLAAGRKPFVKRYAVVGDDAAKVLQTMRADRPRVDTYEPADQARQQKRPVIFLFPGQGAQYKGMAQLLYKNEPLFRKHLDHCFALYKDITATDLYSIVFPGIEAECNDRGDNGLLDHTEYAQPALYIFEYAVARFLADLGIRPDYMIGHSIGEYAAACVAGVFSFETGLRIVIRRGRLMQDALPGSMLSVACSPDQLLPKMGAGLNIAAVNSPGSCVVSGDKESIAQLEALLKADCVGTTLLKTSHAFHSKMMEPVLAPFGEYLARFIFEQPALSFISNISGGVIDPGKAITPQYWVDHLYGTVDFLSGADFLLRTNPDGIFIETGPGHTLSSAIRKNGFFRNTHAVVNLIRNPVDLANDHQFFLRSLGQLWCRGIDVDFARQYPGHAAGRLHLPGYPFEPVSFNATLQWRSVAELKASAGVRADAREEVFYIPFWEQDVETGGLVGPGRYHWLVFVNSQLDIEKLSSQLAEYSRSITWVEEGPAFQDRGLHRYTIDPTNKEDYMRLLTVLNEDGRPPERVIHAWTLLADNDDGLSFSRLERSGRLGFYALIYLVQATGALGITADMRFFILTNGSMSVWGDEGRCPEKALMEGLAKIIPVEYNHIRCTYIDVLLEEIKEKNGALPPVLLNRLLEEGGFPRVAIRGRRAWRQNYRRLKNSTPAGDKTLIKAGGVYLITGGLGGMALYLARHLVKEVKASVILVSRSGAGQLDEAVPQDRIKLKLLEELRAEPDKVLFWKADIADEEMMQALVVQYEAQSGHIDGVLHTAGTIDTFGVIQRRKKDDFEDSLRAKVAGTLVLYNLFRKRSLDLVVLFSSGGSITFGTKYGEAGYVAANSFLDAVAGDAFGRSTVVKCINWCDWNEVGISVRSIDRFFAQDPAGRSAAYREFEKNAISPEEGVRIFLTLMNIRETRIAISRVSLKDLTEDIRIGQETKRSLYRKRPKEALVRPGVVGEKPGKPMMNELQKNILGIWQDYFGYESIGIEDNIFELGGNSLDIAQINETLKSRLQIDIPLVTLFEYPTIARITEYLTRATQADAAVNTGERIEEGKSTLSKIRAIARK